MSGITLGALYNGALTFNGDIAEIIIYNKALINNERILIEKYLTKKYFPDQYHPIRYVNLGPDIWANNFCDTTINAGNFFAHYHWSTGDSTSSIKVNTAGTYWVTAIDSSGFTSSDTIIVHKPTITAHDTLACIGSNVTLYTGLKTPYTFHWQPGGSTADSLVVTAPSTNTLTITDTLGCSTIKIIKVSADSFAAKVSLGTPPITKCSGDTVYLVKGAGAAASYDWWDGTAHSYGTSYPIAWLTGTHPLLLTVKDTMGCVANISTNIHIQGAQPIVGFTYTPVCYPGSTFTVFKDTSSAVAGSSLSSWQWDFGNGDIAVYLGSSAFTYPYDSAAIYNVKLTVTTITGCSKSVTEHVPVYSVPVPAFQPHIGCSGVPMKMKDRSTSLLGDVNTWNWNISDPFSTQNTSSDTNIIHTFNNTGYYKVKLVVTTVPGCKDSITDSISIRYAPKVGFSYTNVCFGNPVYFNDTTQTQPWASITYWYWNFGNGQTSSIQNPVCIFGNAGTFPVSLTINTINGCVVTDTTPVVVHAIPEAIFTTTDVCAKNPYIFHDSSKVALPDTISSWLWTFGNVTTSNSKNPAITFPASGTFTVSLDVSSNAGCKDSTKHTVHVDPIPTAAFTPDSYFGVAPFTVTFDNTSQGAANYLWNFGDTLGTSTQTDPNYLYTKNGIYTVSLIAYNQYGCKDSTTQKMMVIPTIADIAVSNVKLTKPSQGNYDTLSADITNLGTRWISEINLYANAADGTSFMETWSNSLHPLEPGATMTYVFNAKYKLSDDQSASYFCVDAEIADKNTTDDNPKNNEQCITYSNSFTALAPYPSPTHDQVYIDFILPPSYNAAKESDNVTIELFGIKGDKVRTILSGKAEKGLNRLTVDVSSLNIGVYTYRIMFRENINIFRFVKY
jgi:PKD repeat protein